MPSLGQIQCWRGMMEQLTLTVLLYLVWDTVFRSEPEPHTDIIRRALGIRETDGWTSQSVWLPAIGVNGTCTLAYLTPLPFRQQFFPACTAQNCARPSSSSQYISVTDWLISEVPTGGGRAEPAPQRGYGWTKWDVLLDLVTDSASHRKSCRDYSLQQLLSI